MRRGVLTGTMAVALAGAAGAEDWRALDDAGIAAALSGRSLTYEDGARQDFGEGGVTTYRAAGDSRGRWRAEGGRYCSVWPPPDAWSCYLLERDAESGRLRFVGGGGDITVGEYSN